MKSQNPFLQILIGFGITLLSFVFGLIFKTFILGIITLPGFQLFLNPWVSSFADRVFFATFISFVLLFILLLNRKNIGLMIPVTTIIIITIGWALLSYLLVFAG